MCARCECEAALVCFLRTYPLASPSCIKSVRGFHICCEQQRRPLARRRAAMLRRIPAVAGGSAGAAWLWLSNDVDTAPARAARSLGYGLLIGYDYKFGPAARTPRASTEHALALSATHLRSANRMLAVCRAHGGLYNKLGQYISSMTVALPPEYPLVLAACQVSSLCRASPWPAALATTPAALPQSPASDPFSPLSGPCAFRSPL
jgi:hypothetical protein